MRDRSRPAWDGSTRRGRLPATWPQLRAEALRLNPAQVCHWCRRAGGTTLDHIVRGDEICLTPGQHGPKCQCNLGWIHDRQDVAAGRSVRNCHGEKTGAEGAAARTRLHREPEGHPALG